MHADTGYMSLPLGDERVNAGQFSLSDLQFPFYTMDKSMTWITKNRQGSLLSRRIIKEFAVRDNITATGHHSGRVRFFHIGQEDSFRDLHGDP